MTSTPPSRTSPVATTIQPIIIPAQPDEIDEDRITVISVLGGPGSGKGTQSAALADTINHIDKSYKVKHISIGAMMRDEMNRPGSSYANYIREAQMNGQLGHAVITFGILSANIRKAFCGGCNAFVLDGYPRNIERLHLLQQNVSRIHVVIYLKCSEEVMMQRLCSRGRSDDNTESIQKRIETFNRETIPVLAELKEKKDKYTRAEDASYFEIDAEEDADVVTSKITEIVKRALLIENEE
ncbi:unnamed protein product [Discula destructiva]